MTIQKITIPDFGDVQKITVVEVFVSVGDTIEEESSLIALESEKAVMDIPSPHAGVIKEVLVKEDDVVGSGDVIVIIEIVENDSAKQSLSEKAPVAANEQADKKNDSSAGRVGQVSHATPSLRAFARVQHVELEQIVGTGPNGRILKEDVLAVSSSGDQTEILQDFSSHGPVEIQPLGRIQKISGPHLQKSWISIPHVTHFDEADITELENFRKRLNSEAGEHQIRYSLLVFICSALVATLKKIPFFNCSLVPDGENVILKKYYHIGIAVDTDGGLVVPVIKDVDQKGCAEIAEELQRLSSGARAGKLAIPDIQGATITISSLGGIGGTGFTPIVNSPQVAILGLSRSYEKPVWDGENFIPRLTLPFSVSYDHRVIDGAEAARFCRSLRMNIEDLKRTLL